MQDRQPSDRVANATTASSSSSRRSFFAGAAAVSAGAAAVAVFPRRPFHGPSTHSLRGKHRGPRCLRYLFVRNMFSI